MEWYSWFLITAFVLMAVAVIILTGAHVNLRETLNSQKRLTQDARNDAAQYELELLHERVEHAKTHEQLTEARRAVQLVTDMNRVLVAEHMTDG